MTAPRPPKKSETLEVRLPHAAKSAFMTRCHASGLTASEVVRTLIERDATASRSRRTLGVRQALAAAIAGLAIGAVAAPSIAQALPGSRVAFDRMDADRDGVVTFAEFQAR
ncbi:MAG: hypothetical protein K2X25_09750 [Caulobacteraceae bacterium]|nr:hypothetical protein [Caulobacteraceae bacterium]